MSELDNVKQQVELARDQITTATTACEAARQKTHVKARAFAELGLDGVCAHLNTAAEHLTTGNGQLATAHTLVGEAVTVLDGVSGTTSLPDTITALTNTEQKLNTGGADIRAATASVGTEAFNYARETEVQAPIARITTAVDAITQAANAIDVAITTTRDYRDRIQQAIQATTTGGNTGTGTMPSRKAAATTADALPDFNPRRFDPRGMAGIQPYSEIDTAEGNLFFPPGSKVNNAPLRATPGKSAFAPGELKPGFETTKPALGHIEGNAAAEMLHKEQTESCLYLNTYPCRTEAGNCHEELHKYIAQDAKMYIHAQLDDGTPYYKRVTGSGEALS